MTIWADVPFLLVLVIITVLLGPCISTDDTALADRTNGRAYVAVLSVCLSVVCNVCIVAKRCVLAKNCLKKQTGCLAYGDWGIEWFCCSLSHSQLCTSDVKPQHLTWIEWSRDRWRHMTLKGQGYDPNTPRAQYLISWKQLEMPTTRCCDRRILGSSSAILATAWLLVYLIVIWGGICSCSREKCCAICTVTEWFP